MNLINLAAIAYPNIDPFIFQWGGFGVSWYAFMYLMGFVAAYFITKRRVAKGQFHLTEPDDHLNLITDVCLGVILGGRLGYVLFYNPVYFFNNPSQIIALWNGGMSFHGGLLGVMFATYLFAKRRNLPFFHILDTLALCTPIGLGLGRIANFINGELYGRVTDVAWGMIFPQGGPLPRHPSQLYESFLEGPVLFLLIWAVMKWKEKANGYASAMMLIGYGSMRFIVEFFRQPDSHLGFVLGPFSMGQLLSSGMILAGIFLWGLASRWEKSEAARA
jgi:phosphatidylglycerol:prolipoprotein diacylglycerol transferase